MTHLSFEKITLAMLCVMQFTKRPAAAERDIVKRISCAMERLVGFSNSQRITHAIKQKQASPSKGESGLATAVSKTLWTLLRKDTCRFTEDGSISFKAEGMQQAVGILNCLPEMDRSALNRALSEDYLTFETVVRIVVACFARRYRGGKITATNISRVLSCLVEASAQEDWHNHSFMQAVFWERYVTDDEQLVFRISAVLTELSELEACGRAWQHVLQTPIKRFSDSPEYLAVEEGGIPLEAHVRCEMDSNTR